MEMGGEGGAQKKKGVRQGKTAPWLKAIASNFKKFIPIGPDGKYVSVSVCVPHAARQCKLMVW